MMKNQFSLSIPTPCSEKWNQFTPTSGGGFCSSCSKEVVDFTKMSEEEIIQFFKNKPLNTCGRFRPYQLKIYSPTSSKTIHGRFKWLYAGVISLSFLLMGKQGSARVLPGKTHTELIQLLEIEHKKDDQATSKHTIKGVVTDSDKTPLPGVNVILKGSNIGTTTDINGQFIFPMELEAGQVLVFDYIGFESKEYVVPKNALAVVEIPILMLYYDIMGDIAIDGVYQPDQEVSRTWWHKLKGLF